MDLLSLTATHSSNSDLMRTLFTNTGKSHSFVVDTSSVRLIIFEINLLLLYNDVHLNPHVVYLLVSLAICYPWSVQSIFHWIKNDGCVNIPFPVSECGSSVHGLKGLSSIDISSSLFTNSSDTTLIKDLFLECSKAVEGMRIHLIHLEVEGEPIFLKHKLVPYD